MATPNIVPRSDSEGGLGTASKYWASAYIDLIYVGAGKMGRDADNLIDFSTDNQIDFRVAAGHRLRLTQTSLAPITTDSVSLGTSSLNFSDLFLDSGAVINFDNGNVTLTHSSNRLTLADADELSFGDGNDFNFSWNGTNGHIKNETSATGSHIYISNYSNDGDIVFRSDDGSNSLTEYFRLDGSVAKTTVHRPLKFDDSISAEYGTGTDMIMYHSGSTGYIENYNGNFQLIQQVDDGDIIFKCDDGSGSTTAYITLDGSEKQIHFYQNTKHNDNVEARFGAGNDLKIYHDGSHSYIAQSGTGDLTIKNTTDDRDIYFQCDDGAGGVANYFYLDGSSATHDGSATTALYTNWPDKSRITLGTSHDIYMYHDGANTWFENQTGDLTFRNSANDKDIIFQSDNGSGGVAEYFKLDGSANSGGLPVTVFPDNSLLWIGTDGGGMRFHADGNNSEIQNHVGNLTIVNNTDNGSIIFKNDDGSGGTTTYFYLDGALSTPHTRFPDSSILVFGTDADLAINHNGTNSLIENYTGDLYIKNHADDKDISFQCDDGAGGYVEYFRLDGSIATHDGSANTTRFTKWPDKSIISLGTGNDIRIYHDGTNSYLDNLGGDYYIRQKADDKDLIFMCDDGSGSHATYFFLDGSLATHDGSATTGLFTNWPDNSQITLGNSRDLRLYHTGTDSIIETTGTGDLYIRQSTDDKDLILQSDNGSGGVMDYILLDGSDVSTAIKTIKVLMPNLPTSDPTTAGQLWNDSGTLKISAG